MMCVEMKISKSVFFNLDRSNVKKSNSCQSETMTTLPVFVKEKKREKRKWKNCNWEKLNKRMDGKISIVFVFDLFFFIFPMFIKQCKI